MGLRQSMGLFVSPINTSTTLGINQISLAFAVGQLWWGLTQPFAGAMSERHGAGPVLLTGVLMVALGTALTPFMHTLWGLILSIGILGAGGAGIAGPAVLMATANRMIAPGKRGMANGVINAGGSFGQFLMAPIAGGLISAFGWSWALQILGGLALIALPAILVLRARPLAQKPGANRMPPGPSDQARPTGQALRLALATPSYLMLATGFFVCGFHVAFLSTHLPGVVVACGLPEAFAGWSLAMIGLFNIIGSLAMGWAVGHWRMKSLLAMVYAVRAVAVVVFLLAPKTGSVMLIFAAVMGITYLSTVPPTAGLVAKLFGQGNMATLYGLVLLIHQIGAFFGAWLGGRIYVASGSYDWMWYIDIVLAVAAALINLPIREAKLVRAAF
jgi:MFS family permease